MEVIPETGTKEPAVVERHFFIQRAQRGMGGPTIFPDPLAAFFTGDFDVVAKECPFRSQPKRPRL